MCLFYMSIDVQKVLILKDNISVMNEHKKCKRFKLKYNLIVFTIQPDI